MTRASIRLWFCLAVAAIAAALADPVVEYLSNARVFGRGNFTDHSNADVLPVLLAGLIFAGLHLVLKIRSALHKRDDASRDVWRESYAVLGGRFFALLPFAYVLQLIVLYGMETFEQRLVWGHTLGGTIWLGGPVWASLLAHAVTCAIVAFAAARLIRALGRTTVRVLRAIAALTTLPSHPVSIVIRVWDRVAVSQVPVRSRIGERGPPLLSV